MSEDNAKPANPGHKILEIMRDMEHKGQPISRIEGGTEATTPTAAETTPPQAKAPSNSKEL
ncbi:MAG: hypothetical protein R3D71_07070 [Rickettsiales bacterium]